MSLLTHTVPAAAPASSVTLLDMAELFWDAHRRVEELHDNLTDEQRAGIVDLPPDLEYWDGEARARYVSLLTAFGIDPGDDDDTFGTLSDLYAPQHVRATVPTGTTNWERGRGA